MDASATDRILNMLNGLPAAYEDATSAAAGPGAAASGDAQDLPPHYELTVCVLEESILTEYELAAEAHNEPVLRYLAGQAEGACDAGFDLFVPEEQRIPAGYGAHTATLIDHKVKCCMRVFVGGPPGGTGRLVGYYLYPRSSMGAKTPFRLANSVGIIDAGYRGPIKAALDLVPSCVVDYPVHKGARLVQLCAPNLTYPMAVKITTSEAELGGPTARGEGGFGSTGS